MSTEREEINKKFRERAIKLRKEGGITQERIAYLMGLDTQIIDDMETGKIDLTYNYMVYLSLLLHIEVYDLFPPELQNVQLRDALLIIDMINKVSDETREKIFQYIDFISALIDEKERKEAK